jgi:pyruvate/oxaloacetate carboxyltransferase
MTKRDYELVAAAIRTVREDVTLTTREHTCSAIAGFFAGAFAAGNDRFDAARFCRAAGVSEEAIYAGVAALRMRDDLPTL